MRRKIKYWVIGAVIVSLLVMPACSVTSGLFKEVPEDSKQTPSKSLETADTSRKEAVPVKHPSCQKPSRMDAEISETHKDIAGKLALARKYMKKKQYDRVALLADAVAKAEPSNRKATELANKAYYKMGKHACKNNDYMTALEMFDQVAPDYRDVRTWKVRARKEKKKKAEIYYKTGVKYFVEEELKKAIAAWKKTLILYPEHPTAEKDVKNAKELLQRFHKIEDNKD